MHEGSVTAASDGDAPAEPFNAVIHLDHTRALEPLETVGETPVNEVPDTYPAGV